MDADALLLPVEWLGGKVADSAVYEAPLLSDKLLSESVGLPPAGAAMQMSAADRPAMAGFKSSYQMYLKLLMCTVFLPEGLSLFIGDVRLPVVRVLLIIFIFTARRSSAQKLASGCSARIPSDNLALAAAVWMIVAGIATDGFSAGLKGAGALALEFSGAYYVFRHLLGPVNSSTQLIKFSCKVMIVVVALALLDVPSGHMFTHDLVTKLTGYGHYFDPTSDGYVRNGLVRATGPLEHSILFATACTWFGVLALCTFRFSGFSIFVAIVMIIGVWFSGSRGPLAAYMMSIGLTVIYYVTRQFTARWIVLKCILAGYVVAVFCYSSAPVSTLLAFGGVDPEAGWYRQGIWDAAGPLVLDSPLFGIGLGDWNWQDFPALAGPSVDALWLRAAMMFGIPGSLLIFVTVVGASWLGQIDKSEVLSIEERRASVALGIVAFGAVFMGFTVHFWGTCWILTGAFAGMRANLAEAAIVRARTMRSGIDDLTERGGDRVHSNGIEGWGNMPKGEGSLSTAGFGHVRRPESSI